MPKEQPDRATDNTDPDDTSIHALDGTRWIYSPEFDIWNGFEPGEPGLWEMSPTEMERFYPEVLRKQIEGNARR